MNVGDEVPDFELLDQHGQRQQLSVLLAGGPLALFFYPAAMTTGCTKEACHFRDLGAEFAAAGVQRIGISADQVDKQAEFDRKNGLGYPLLSDPDGTVAAIFGVKRGKLGARLGAPVKRTTFAIGTDRRVRAVVSSEFDMNTHADRALAALRG